MDQMQADGIAPWTLPCSELNCKKRDKKKKKKIARRKCGKKKRRNQSTDTFPQI